MSGSVYFVTDGDAIKIGFAKNLRERLRLLQVSHHFPLFLIAAISGTRNDEAMLHGRFSDLRLRGEWFQISSKITHAIGEFRTQGRVVDEDDIDEWTSKAQNTNFR